MEQQISIYKVIGGSAAVATADGETLFKDIFSVLAQENIVILDFNGIEALTSTFLNSAIGQLYNKFDSPFLQTHLKVINISKEDMESLKKVVERAKQYFKDKKSIENPIRDVLDEEQDS